jgi:hypothetical protein
MSDYIHTGGGTFTSPRNVELMEVALRHGLEPNQFSTLAAFITEVERLAKSEMPPQIPPHPNQRNGMPCRCSACELVRRPQV